MAIAQAATHVVKMKEIVMLMVNVRKATSVEKITAEVHLA